MFLALQYIIFSYDGKLIRNILKWRAFDVFNNLKEKKKACCVINYVIFP